LSWLLPEAVRRALDSHVYPALVNGAGVVVLALLIVLLVEAQLVQAFGTSRFRLGRTVRVLVVPLLPAFAFVLALRLIDVLSHR
jgi:hypothetical protein